jgi:hypothetical protein
MKKGRNLILIGFFLISLAAYAQNSAYTFKVLANKGANEVKTGNTWQAVKTGASLKAGDELKVSENSYLGLVSASGRPLELKQAGNYKVDELEKKVSGGSSVMNKYADFILSSNSAEAKKNRLSATGAVHRGLEDIKVYLPENQYANVYNSVAVINWEAKTKGPYIVTFKNLFEDELMKSETPENTFQVDLNDPKFAKENIILVEIKSKTDQKRKSEQRLIKRMTPAEQEKVKKSLVDLGPEVNEPTPLNKFILAGFYEENKLFIDAITAYEQAIKLAPDVPSYKEAYDEFLLRNKLKDQK